MPAVPGCKIGGICITPVSLKDQRPTHDDFALGPCRNFRSLIVKDAHLRRRQGFACRPRFLKHISKRHHTGCFRLSKAGPELRAGFTKQPLYNVWGIQSKDVFQAFQGRPGGLAGVEQG